LKEPVFDDFLIERGIFAAAVFARVVDEKLALRDGSRAERVGLDDVRTGFEKPAMNVANRLRLRQRSAGLCGIL
jgi:hypothetical protein